jgi:hypothetical protein
MEKLARVQKDLEAVVDAARKGAEERLQITQAVCASERQHLHSTRR